MVLYLYKIVKYQTANAWDSKFQIYLIVAVIVDPKFPVAKITYYGRE